MFTSLRSRFTRWAAPTFLLWAAVILAGYYLFHKPFTPQSAAALARSGRDLFTALAVLTACGAVGQRLLNRREGSSTGEDAAIQSALGAGILSLVWLAAGFAGLYHPWTAWLVLLALLTVFRREAAAWWKSIFWGLRAAWEGTGAFGRVLQIICWLLLSGGLLTALAPPFKYDALTYHLQLPRLYIDAGQMIFPPSNLYWGHPQLVEMLYTWASLLGRPQTAAVLGWCAAAMMVLGLTGFASTLSGLKSIPAGRTAGWVAAAALLCGLTARAMTGWAYTDLFSAWMGLAVLISLHRWFECGHFTDLAWGAILCGFAVSIKYTSGLIAILFFLAVILWKGVRRPTRVEWIASAGLCLAVFLPWALKNLAFTGNPLYPYLFATPWVSAERAAAANTAAESSSWLSAVFLPLDVTWRGIDSAPGPGSDMGPLLILLALPGVWPARKSATDKAVLLLLALTWLALALGGLRFGHLAQPRLYYVALPALAVLAGWGWIALQSLPTQRIRAGWVASAMILLVCGVTLIQDLTAGNQAAEVVLGRQSEAEYLEDRLGVYAVAMRELAAFPPDSKVLFLWEARGLYAPPFCDADTWIDRYRTDFRELHDPQQILSRWRSSGYTHILVDNSAVENVRAWDTQLSPAAWAAWDQLVAALPAPAQLAGGFYSLYSLTGR